MELEPAAEGAALLLGPIGFWAIFHHFKYRHQPEPVRNLLLVYLLGVAACYLVGAIWAWRMALIKRLHAEQGNE